MRVHKGDEIIVLAGKFRGEHANVKEAIPSTNQVVLDSLNIVKRHTRPSSTPQGVQRPGGIIDKFVPMHVSNVALWCNGHKGPAKVGFVDDDGEKVRVCRKCGEVL
jgi:large subunit ribosomal protein L24